MPLPRPTSRSCAWSIAVSSSSARWPGMRRSRPRSRARGCSTRHPRGRSTRSTSSRRASGGSRSAPAREPSSSSRSASTDRVGALLELHRAGGPFGATEREAARVAAGQVALVLRAYADGDRGLVRLGAELTAEALAAGGDELRGAERIARLAADATGAAGLPDLADVRSRGSRCSPVPAWPDERAVWPLAEAVLEARVSGLDDLDDSTVASFLRRPAADRRSPARVPAGGRAARELARHDRVVRHPRRPGPACRRARGRPPSRARAHARPAVGRRPGDLAALALAHARDRGRPRAAVCST